MEDDISKAQPVETPQVEEKPVEPMPSSEQTTDPQPTETPEVPQETEGELPEGVSERTRKEFEKLKAQLRAEREKSQLKQYGSSVFDSFRAPEEVNVQPEPVAQPNFTHLTQNQVQQISQTFVDADGNVDVERLNLALNEANRRAADAESKFRQINERVTRFEEDQQVREAHDKFPHLDPTNPNFDSKFYDLVSAKLLQNMYMGKKETLAQAAASIADVYKLKDNPDVQREKEKAVKEYQQSLSKKEQAGTVLAGNTSSSRQADKPNIEDLRRRTRLGDDNALFERLKALESSQG